MALSIAIHFAHHFISETRNFHTLQTHMQPAHMQPNSYHNFGGDCNSPFFSTTYFSFLLIRAEILVCAICQVETSRYALSAATCRFSHACVLVDINRYWSTYTYKMNDYNTENSECINATHKVKRIIESIFFSSHCQCQAYSTHKHIWYMFWVYI